MNANPKLEELVKMQWQTMTSRTLIHVETANTGKLDQPYGVPIVSLPKSKPLLAELIATLPDLLKQRNELLDALEDLLCIQGVDLKPLLKTPILNKARAAIANAKK